VNDSQLKTIRLLHWLPKSGPYEAELFMKVPIPEKFNIESLFVFVEPIAPPFNEAKLS
jgi:hypothetical protein